MCRLLIKVGQICVLASFCGGTANATTWDQALLRLEKWDREYTRSNLEEWGRVLRDGAPDGDTAVALRLVNIVANDATPLPVREVALELACEKSDATAALALVATLTRWCEEAIDRESADETQRNRNRLITVTIEQQLRGIQRVLPEYAPLLRLLTLAARASPDPKLLSDVSREIARSPAALQERRAAALEVIDAFKFSGICPEPLLGILGPESFPALRLRVRQTDDPKTFHFMAAGALAHLGDQEILPDLQAWLQNLGPETQKLGAPVRQFVWWIEAQHPPAKLIDYIKDSGSEWAMRRAVELQLPQSEIRSAALAYAEHLKISGTRQGANNLVLFKYHALKEGVLEPEDLPEVVIPEFFYEVGDESDP